MAGGERGRRLVLALAAGLVASAIGYWLGRPAELPVAPAPTVNEAADALAERAPAPDAWQAIVTARTQAPVARAVDPVAPTPLPSAPFGAAIDELKRRADAGDAQAAKRLADGYRRCETFSPAKDAAELERRTEARVAGQLHFADQLVAALKARAAEQGAELGELPTIDSFAVYRDELAAQRELAADCDGIERAAARDWFAWYERAAELGDAEAEVAYWFFAFRYASLAQLDDLVRRKDIAAVALQRALARGDWRALAAIGVILRQGHYAAPDPYHAYAWLFAASHAPTHPIDTLPWLREGMPGLDGADTQDWLSRELRQTAMALDAVQRAEAERLGASLYRRCCTGGRP